MQNKTWQLPEAVIEHLPQSAEQIEFLRRRFLDTARLWGFRFVMPPLVEYLDSLLAGSRELYLQTFKITDQDSGKSMGIRADITPQIARIDAHRLPTDEISRYAYCGEVLRTTTESLQPRRNPLIAGAELFGVKELSGDIEIISLLLQYLTELNLKNSVLTLSHSGILETLAKDLNKSQRKKIAKALNFLNATEDLPEEIKNLIELAQNGDLEELKKISGLEKVAEEIAEVEKLLKSYFPEQKIALDISNTGNYGYHSGILFALYAAGHYGALARGGRYDGLGEVYGKARAATGFSLDLLTLSEILENKNSFKESERVELPTNNTEFKALNLRRLNGEIISFKH